LGIDPHTSLSVHRAKRQQATPESQSVENVLAILDTLAKYLPKKCRRISPLHELIRIISAWAIDRRNARVVANTMLVWKFGVQYYKAAITERRLDPDDAFQEGADGLIRACDLFDEARGLKFSHYAVWQIRQRIQRFLHRASLIDLPSHLFFLSKKRIEALSPSDKKRRAQALLVRNVKNLGSVESKNINYDSVSPYENAIADKKAAGERDRADDRLDVQDLMRCLGGTEKRIIELVFMEGLSLDEVAKRVAVGGKPMSRERMRQLKERAIGRMKVWAEKRRRKK